MGEWAETTLGDGRIEGKEKLLVNGIAVNVTYHRPDCKGDELEKAAKPFWDTFYRLIREGKTTLYKPPEKSDTKLQ